MFARITNYKMKPDRIADATALLEEIKPKILAMPGTLRFMNAHDETGAGYVVTLIESKEVAEANTEAALAIWAHFADFLEEMPTPQGYGVVADWSN